MVGGSRIVRRQVKGTRKVIRGQARGISTLGARQRSSLKRQARKTRKSTRRILRGRR